MTFAEQVRRIAKDRGVEAMDIARGISLQAVESVIEKTPVDEGFARGSWDATVNAISTDVVESSDKSGQSAISKASTVIDTVKAGDTFYLVSNIPYMPVLEYGGYGTGPGATDKTTRDGYSVQAPNGMVRLTVREILAGLRR